MSEYQHDILSIGVAPDEVEKMILNLCNKEQYVLHYRNLQLYLCLCMHLIKVRHTLRSVQSLWMEPFIWMTTKLWKGATSDFEKNKSVFSKMMEKFRKKVDIRLVWPGEEDKVRKLITSLAYALANIFDDKLVWIQMHKSPPVLNCPVCMGMNILTSPRGWCMTSTANRWRPVWGSAAGSSTQIPTTCSLRSRLRTSTGTWAHVQISTICLLTQWPPTPQHNQ